MFNWLKRPYRITARGVLCSRLAWEVVPGLQAAAFKAAHPDADNDASFAHVMHGVARRYPQDLDACRAAVAELEAVVRRFPGCVVFVHPPTSR